MPGGPLSEGEERTYDFLIAAPADAPIGVLGTVSVELHPAAWHEDVDVNPAGNTDTFKVTTLEAP